MLQEEYVHFSLNLDLYCEGRRKNKNDRVISPESVHISFKVRSANSKLSYYQKQIFFVKFVLPRIFQPVGTCM